MDGWTDFSEEVHDWTPDLPAAVTAWLEERMTEHLQRPGIVYFSTAEPQQPNRSGGSEWLA